MSDLSGQNILITGGAGLLGAEHGTAVTAAGARAILVDIDAVRLDAAADRILARVPGAAVMTRTCDITDRRALGDMAESLRAEIGDVTALINNAAINPTMSNCSSGRNGTLEDYPINSWNQEFAVGVTGALLCIQVFGPPMAERGAGSIVNIASDLGVIAPDHRIYTPERRMEAVTSFKPVSYSVCKSALIGLTRYVATYWAHRGVRCNALAPAGVFNGQDPVLVQGLEDRIPMRRMATASEYHGSVVFLCSNASAYMTGQVLVVDGGRSVW